MIPGPFEPAMTRNQIAGTPHGNPGFSYGRYLFWITLVTVSSSRSRVFKSGVFWQTEAKMNESVRAIFQNPERCTEFAENRAINFPICPF
jgi:hypothetical protein